MTRLYSQTKWPKPAAKKHLPQRTWLVHVQPCENGLTHWLIVAKTLDLAWSEAQELPRQPGTAPRLGGVITAGAWPAFMREKVSTYCDVCNHKSLLMADHEERTWDALADAFEDGYKEVIS